MSSSAESRPSAAEVVGPNSWGLVGHRDLDRVVDKSCVERRPVAQPVRELPDRTLGAGSTVEIEGHQARGDQLVQGRVERDDQTDGCRLDEVDRGPAVEGPQQLEQALRRFAE